MTFIQFKIIWTYNKMISCFSLIILTNQNPESCIKLIKLSYITYKFKEKIKNQKERKYKKSLFQTWVYIHDTWPLQIPSSDMQIFAYNHAQTCIYMHHTVSYTHTNLHLFIYMLCLSISIHLSIYYMSFYLLHNKLFE